MTAVVSAARRFSRGLTIEEGIAPPPTTVERITLSGRQFLGPDGQPIILRGPNWGSWGTVQPGDAAAHVAEGANCVRLPLRWWGFYKNNTSGIDSRLDSAPGRLNPVNLALHDQMIQWAVDAGLWIILFIDSDCGQNGTQNQEEADYCDPTQAYGPNGHNFWTDPGALALFIEVWRFIADRHKATPRIAMFELLPEPNPPGANNTQIRDFFVQVRANVLEVLDGHPKVPFLIGGRAYNTNQAQNVLIPGATDVAYTGNLFAFTSSGNDATILDNLRGRRDALLSLSAAQNVPVYVQQWGVNPGEDPNDTILNGISDMLLESGLGGTYWTYRQDGPFPSQHGIYYPDENNPGQWLVKPLVLATYTHFCRGQLSTEAFDTTFDPLYVGWTPDTGTGPVAQPALAYPAKGVMTNEPAFAGVKFRRMTSIADLSDTVSFNRHNYSRRSPYNANSSRFVSAASNGFWHLYDAADASRLAGGRTATPGSGAILGIAGDAEVLWHPTDPNVIAYTATNGGLVYYQRNIATGVTAVLFDLTSAVASIDATITRCWTVGEGRPSDDWRYWAFQGETNAFGIRRLMVYDRQANAIVWHRALTSNRPNHVSMSPKGNYLVASWYGTIAASLAAEEARADTAAAGVRAYDWRADTHKALAVLGEHSDLALDAEGNEVFVWPTYHPTQDGRGLLDGRLSVCHLQDPSIAYSLPIFAYDGNGTAFHVSGCGRPGWVVVSRYSGGSAWRVELVELKSTSTRVIRLAHHRSSGSPYFAEPQASCNRDTTRVMFATDWGSSGGAVESFEIALPSDWSTR